MTSADQTAAAPTASPPAPPPSPTPLGQADRLETLDVLRGFAVLGILAMNIMSFSGPFVGYMNPTIWPLPYEGGNRVVYWIQHALFDMKMMTLFSLLFGAGVAIWSHKPKSPEQIRSVRWLWLRRMGWLFAIGMAHAWLLWEGDILVSYALSGAILVWWVRNLSNRWLIAIASVLFLVHIGILLLSASFIWLAFGHHETPPLGMPEESYREMREGMTKGMAEFYAPTPEMLQEDIAERRGSYWEVFQVRAMLNIFMQTSGFLMFVFWRASALMLLGIVLVRTGVFTGSRSARFYAIMAGVCYAVGLAIVLTGTLDADRSGFEIVRLNAITMPLNALGSLPVALGHAALLLLLVRLGVLGALRRALAAAGQMAFTNYLSQTIICTTLFYGYGFGLYGKLERPALLAIVVAIWALQLLWSRLWLARFRFGPAEWLWRSLTYWRPQPMRRGA